MYNSIKMQSGGGSFIGNWPRENNADIKTSVKHCYIMMTVFTGMFIG